MRILSFNSHVNYGMVGQNVLLFAAQEQGASVTAMNTVNFSNHPGYGAYAGEIIDHTLLLKQVECLEKLSLLSEHESIFSGYLGSLENAQVVAEAVKKVKSKHSIPYFLDPVMGDRECGFYVQESLAETIKTTLLPIADYMMPNLFELSFLVEEEVSTFEEIEQACEMLFNTTSLKGILVTSIVQGEQIGLGWFTRKESLTCYHPKLHFDFIPRGSGDYTSSLFMLTLLKFQKIDQKGLEKIAHILYNSFVKTDHLKRKELYLYSERPQW